MEVFLMTKLFVSSIKGQAYQEFRGCNLNKDSLSSSSLACGLPSPTFIGNDSRIELSYSVNFFVGDQPIIQREMEGSDEGEMSLKELKDTVLFLAKQFCSSLNFFNLSADISLPSFSYLRQHSGAGEWQRISA